LRVGYWRVIINILCGPNSCCCNDAESICCYDSGTDSPCTEVRGAHLGQGEILVMFEILIPTSV
jgi:hypothetical protein